MGCPCTLHCRYSNTLTLGHSPEFFKQDVDTTVQGGTSVFAADMNMDGSVDVLVTSTLPSSQLAWCVAWPCTAAIIRAYSTVLQRSTGRFLEDLPLKTG